MNYVWSIWDIGFDFLGVNEDLPQVPFAQILKLLTRDFEVHGTTYNAEISETVKDTTFFAWDSQS